MSELMGILGSLSVLVVIWAYTEAVERWGRPRTHARRAPSSPPSVVSIPQPETTGQIGRAS
jgi:hypothetical protein